MDHSRSKRFFEREFNEIDKDLWFSKDTTPSDSLLLIRTGKSFMHKALWGETREKLEELYSLTFKKISDDELENTLSAFWNKTVDIEQVIADIKTMEDATGYHVVKAKSDDADSKYSEYEDLQEIKKLAGL